MQKVYLLLRNNRQTGPHSLEELLQLDPKPFDLIWVEGKSAGWSYPGEIETLKPFIKSTAAPQAYTPPEATPPQPQPGSPKKIFVSMPAVTPAAPPPAPADPIEQKAEALRKKVQEAALQHQEEEPPATRYNRSLNEVEEDYTSWVYRKKINKKSPVNPRTAAVAGIVAVGLLGGWWAGKAVFRDTPAPPVSTMVQQTLAAETPTQEEPNVETVSAEQPVTPSPVPDHPEVPVVKPKERPRREAPTEKAPVATSLPPVVEEAPVAVKEHADAPVGAEQKEVPVAEAPQPKKRTFKEVIGGIFGKKKTEAPGTEEPRGTDNSNGERKATRRDGDAAEPPNINLAEKIDIKMNKGANDWMMGVQGLKLTLHNRNAVAVKKAAVEVRYYSEQNSLLDTKTVYFNNVGPQKSQTVAAPDHRLADHTEVKLLSATGNDDAYANINR